MRESGSGSVGDAVVEVDAGGEMVGADEGAQRLFGWSADELLGRPVGVLIADRGAGVGPVWAGADLVVSARHRDGSQFAARVEVAEALGQVGSARVPLVFRVGAGPLAGGASGRSAGMPEPAVEVEAVDAAAHLRRLRDAAHDINNELSVMLIYSELIDRAAQGHASRRYITEIRDAAERGSDLTVDLVDLARAGVQGGTAAPGPHRARADEDLLLRAVRGRSTQPAQPGHVGVVVVGEHLLFAESLATRLGMEPGIEVLGVGTSGRESLALVARWQPRVLLLDLDMAGQDGVVAAEQVRAEWPGTAVLVMVTGSAGEQAGRRAVRAGCSGYLRKDRAVSEVVDAVRIAATGAVLR